MDRNVRKARQQVKITWAIAVKDVVDAIRNKTLQGIAIGLLLVVLTGRALPLLAGRSGTPSVVVYAEEPSRLIAALQAGDDVHVAKVRSLQEMEDAVRSASVPVLGLHLPAGLDQALEAGQAPPLQATVVHWAAPEDVAEMERAVERALGEAAGRPVEIAVSGQRLYPDPDGGGFTGTIATMIVIAVMVIGMAFVPYLMIEEKETRTLETLLVSPAGIGQVVAGKALAGAAYCLAGGAVVIALNVPYVVHWGVVLLAVFCGMAFAVAVGLLLGVLFDLPQQMGSIGALLAGALMVATFLSSMAALPTGVSAVLRWVPTVALAHALRLSFAARVPAGLLAGDLGAVLAVALAVYALAAWRVGRMDR